MQRTQVTKVGRVAFHCERRERVFDRFHRELGSGATGSGLGLSIVRSVLARHEGTITLRDSEWGGLGVDVRLPAVTPG